MFSIVRNNVSEIYSRPRVTAYATSLGLSPVFALDLAVVDPDDGKPWDFDVPAKCNKALERIRAEKPKLLIGSPMCTAFSLLQNLSKNKGNREEKMKLFARAIQKIYEQNVSSGLYIRLK